MYSHMHILVFIKKGVRVYSGLPLTVIITPHSHLRCSYTYLW